MSAPPVGVLTYETTILKYKEVFMIYPTIDQISQKKFDRYSATIATAKCARLVTDEYVSQRETAEKMISRKETDKPMSALINTELRDNKAIKIAINRLVSGECKIIDTI